MFSGDLTNSQAALKDSIETLVLKSTANPDTAMVNCNILDIYDSMLKEQYGYASGNGGTDGKEETPESKSDDAITDTHTQYDTTKDNKKAADERLVDQDTDVNNNLSSNEENSVSMNTQTEGVENNTATSLEGCKCTPMLHFEEWILQMCIIPTTKHARERSIGVSENDVQLERDLQNKIKAQNRESRYNDNDKQSVFSATDQTYPDMTADSTILNDNVEDAVETNELLDKDIDDTELDEESLDDLQLDIAGSYLDTDDVLTDNTDDLSTESTEQLDDVVTDETEDLLDIAKNEHSTTTKKTKTTNDNTLDKRAHSQFGMCHSSYCHCMDIFQNPDPIANKLIGETSDSSQVFNLPPLGDGSAVKGADNLDNQYVNGMNVHTNNVEVDPAEENGGVSEGLSPGSGNIPDKYNDVKPSNKFIQESKKDISHEDSHKHINIDGVDLDGMLKDKMNEQDKKVHSLEVMIMKLENKLLLDTLKKQDYSSTITRLENHILRMENDLLKMTRDYQSLRTDTEHMSSQQNKYLKLVQKDDKTKSHPEVALYSKKNSEVIAEHQAKIDKLSKMLQQHIQTTEELSYRFHFLEEKNDMLHRMIMNQTLAISSVIQTIQHLTEQTVRHRQENLRLQGLGQLNKLLEEKKQAGSDTAASDVMTGNVIDYLDEFVFHNTNSDTLTNEKPAEVKNVISTQNSASKHSYEPWIQWCSKDSCSFCYHKTFVLPYCIPFSKSAWAQCSNTKCQENIEDPEKDSKGAPSVPNLIDSDKTDSEVTQNSPTSSQKREDALDKTNDSGHDSSKVSKGVITDNNGTDKKSESHQIDNTVDDKSKEWQPVGEQYTHDEALENVSKDEVNTPAELVDKMAPETMIAGLQTTSEQLDINKEDSVNFKDKLGDDSIQETDTKDETSKEFAVTEHDNSSKANKADKKINTNKDMLDNYNQKEQTPEEEVPVDKNNVKQQNNNSKKYQSSAVAESEEKKVNTKSDKEHTSSEQKTEIVKESEIASNLNDVKRSESEKARVGDESKESKDKSEDSNKVVLDKAKANNNKVTENKQEDLKVATKDNTDQKGIPKPSDDNKKAENNPAKSKQPEDKMGQGDNSQQGQDRIKPKNIDKPKQKEARGRLDSLIIVSTCMYMYFCLLFSHQ